MNDFTEEELNIILEGILWRDNHVHPNKRPEELKFKIKSMIHNYCNHESDGMIYTSNPPQNKCKKCGVLYR